MRSGFDKRGPAFVRPYFPLHPHAPALEGAPHTILVPNQVWWCELLGKALSTIEFANVSFLFPHHRLYPVKALDASAACTVFTDSVSDIRMRTHVAHAWHASQNLRISITRMDVPQSLSQPSQPLKTRRDHLGDRSGLRRPLPE